MHIRKLSERQRRTTPRLQHFTIEFIGTTWSDYLSHPQESFEGQFRAHEILRCAQEGVSYNYHYPAPPATSDQTPKGDHLDHCQCHLLDFAQIDVTSVLDMFGLMANVKRAKNHLPESLRVE